jgi:NADH dehydrogenase
MATNIGQLHALGNDNPHAEGALEGTLRPLKVSRFIRARKRTKIVILGGGAGGVSVALELERLSRERDLEVTLVSRDNFYLMTPLLFEAASGSVEARHVVNPIRPLLKRTRFMRAEVTHVDFTRRIVSAEGNDGHKVVLSYDQLVVALGGAPRYELVPGARDALAFKTLEDAIELRTRVIDAFERATLERDPALRERLLRFVIVGGGLVGVELAGELGHFLESLRKTYKSIRREEVSLHLLEAGPKLLPELDPAVAGYVEQTFARRGIRVRTGVAVKHIAGRELSLSNGERVSAGTIVYAAGVGVSPLVASFDLERDRRGRIVTDATMQSVSDRAVWALGDNAAIPIPDKPGETYPALLQHAHREAKALAHNLVRVFAGHAPEPYVAKTLGTAALLGKRQAVISVSGVLIRGFVAWSLWRFVFLLRVPSWERRLRLIADWTVAHLFPRDSAQVRLPTPATRARAIPSPLG